MSVNERGSIVIGWLTKLVALFALVGVLAYDGVLLVVANFGAADAATVAADAASDSYAQTKDIRRAYDAAGSSLEGTKDEVEEETFEVAPDGTVHLVVDRFPATLWMHRVGPLKKWTVVRQAGTGTGQR